MTVQIIMILPISRLDLEKDRLTRLLPPHEVI
jgi:hypothetical protein